jgi:Flagellar biosynthesis protein, FliO
LKNQSIPSANPIAENLGEAPEVAAAAWLSSERRRQIRTWWRRVWLFGRRPPRRLRLAESLALGERRFVAVIEFEQARFLVGGTPSSLVLLARLKKTRGDDSAGQAALRREPAAGTGERPGERSGG